jgi:DNA-binding CsgD family transcriptional regulator
MPKRKKSKDKGTVFKSVAAMPPMLLRPRAVVDWRLSITHLLMALTTAGTRFGLSINALAIEFRQPKVKHAEPVVTRSMHGVPLTRRELHIIALMADHLSNQQIADALVIEISTLRTHLQHIYRKLGNRGKVLEWWERHRREAGDHDAKR